MKKYEKVLEKISEVSSALRWTDLQCYFDKHGIKYQNGKASKKVYIGNNVWTLHETKHSLKRGSIAILKRILIEENYLDS